MIKFVMLIDEYGSVISPNDAGFCYYEDDENAEDPGWQVDMDLPDHVIAAIEVLRQHAVETEIQKSLLLREQV